MHTYPTHIKHDKYKEIVSAIYNVSLKSQQTSCPNMKQSLIKVKCIVGHIPHVRYTLKLNFRYQSIYWLFSMLYAYMIRFIFLAKKKKMISFECVLCSRNTPRIKMSFQWQILVLSILSLQITLCCCY